MTREETSRAAAEPLLPGSLNSTATDGVTYGAAGAGTEAVTDPEHASATFTRNLGALDAFAIVISIVIGSGIFTSPGSIDTNVPSPGVALVVWLVGGVLAWTGASTMVELGTAIPGEGTHILSFRLRFFSAYEETELLTQVACSPI